MGLNVNTRGSAASTSLYFVTPISPLHSCREKKKNNNEESILNQAVRLFLVYSKTLLL